PVTDGGTIELVVSNPSTELRIAEPTDNWWGGVNLGEEPTSLVYINVSSPLPRSLPPDYPAVRLRIDPGEGFRLPSARMAVAGCTLTGPDMLLRIAMKKAM